MQKYLNTYCQVVHDLNVSKQLKHENCISLGYFHKNFTKKNISKAHLTIMYVIQGQGEYIDQQQRIELTPGKLLIRRPNTVHSIYRDSTKNWLEFYLIIPNAMLQFIDLLELVPTAVLK